VWQQIGGQLLKAKERLATNLMVYLCARGFTLQFSIKEFANVLVSPFAAETRSEILQHETRSEILQETSLLPLLRLLAHLPKCRQCRQESKAPPLVSSLTSAQVLVGPGLPAWVQGWEGHVLVTISQGTITTRAPMSRFVACAACGGICMGVEHVVTEMLHTIHSPPSFTCRRQNLHPKLAEERFN